MSNWRHQLPVNHILYLFALCVQSRSGFIQEKDLGVPHESSGNGNALLLSSRQLGASGPNIGVITLERSIDINITLQLEFTASYRTVGYTGMNSCRG